MFRSPLRGALLSKTPCFIIGYLVVVHTTITLIYMRFIGEMVIENKFMNYMHFCHLAAHEKAQFQLPT